MRILVVADGFPPVERDASALGCRDIVDGLTGRGHRVRVLAGGSFPAKIAEAGFIHRRLVRDRIDRISWQDIFRKELANQTALRDSILEFRPDVAFFFDLSQVSSSLPILAGEMGTPGCLYVESDWLATWEMDRWYREQPRGTGGRRALRFLSRRFDLGAFSRPLTDWPAIFTSRYLREATERVNPSSSKAEVVFPGVDIGRFPFKNAGCSDPARLLYLGPAGLQYGIKTAIEALGILKREDRFSGLSLTVAVRSHGSPEILASLHNRAASAGVLGDVSFIDYSPDRSLPDLYLAHDLFVYPAARVESMTPSLLEAMACGLGVVSTATGGNAEVLEDGVNALVIPPEEPELLARSLRRLLDEPDFEKTIAAEARRTIMEGFRLDQSVEAIENILMDIAGRAAAGRTGRISANHQEASKEEGAGRLQRISGRLERWFLLSGLLVWVRSLFKPKALPAILKSKARSFSRRLSLLFFPRVLKWIHRRPGRDRNREAKDEPREILVVQLADLGDIVLSGPFLRNLRAFAPRSRIVLAVQPGLMNVVEKCPYVDEIMPFDYRSLPGWNDAFQGSFRWWVKGLGLAYKTFAGHRFDLAVSLRWNEDAPQAASLILMASSGAPRRVAYLNSPTAFPSSRRSGVNDLITDGPRRGAVKHEVECQADLLRFLGGRSENMALEVWTTADDGRTARDLLEKRRIAAGDLLIGLAPGARWEFRRWPAERFVELARWLQDDFDARILILGGKPEKALAEEIERGLKPEWTVNLAGQTTIREMASVLKFCRIFVGIDSGPMHVAVAAGVPVVGLFGAGEYNRFKPWGSGHEVVHLGLRCSPCPEFCLFDEARCIRGISVDQVKDVLKKMIAA